MIAGLAIGLMYRIWTHDIRGIGYFLAGVGIPFLCTYPLYKIGTFGGGDVKLLSVAAGFLKVKAVPVFLSLCFGAGAAVALMKMLYYGSVKERMAYFTSYVWDVCRTGQWHIYETQDQTKAWKKRNKIQFAGPVMFSILMYMGGFY